MTARSQSMRAPWRHCRAPDVARSSLSGFSGGVDSLAPGRRSGGYSTALRAVRVVAVHIDHSYGRSSDAEQREVAVKFALWARSSWPNGLHLIFDASILVSGLEEAARRERYLASSPVARDLRQQRITTCAPQRRPGRNGLAASVSRRRTARMSGWPSGAIAVPWWAERQRQSDVGALRRIWRPFSQNRNTSSNRTSTRAA